MLEIASFTLGPVQTNAYLIADSETHEAAVIDPAWDGHVILAEAHNRGWRIAHLWYTHAHFDHIGGAGAIADDSQSLAVGSLASCRPCPCGARRVAHRSSASRLIQVRSRPSTSITGRFCSWGAVALKFGLRPVTLPAIASSTFHGSMPAKLANAGVCFCGDLIFQNSVGRTDLPGRRFRRTAYVASSCRSLACPMPRACCLVMALRQR